MLRRLAHGTRLVIATIIGWAFVALGLVMLVTPGPGLLALATGMAVLSRHYHWADRVRTAVRARIVALRPTGASTAAAIGRAPTTTAEPQRDVA
jgi:hypothetical protein